MEVLFIGRGVGDPLHRFRGFVLHLTGNVYLIPMLNNLSCDREILHSVSC